MTFDTSLVDVQRSFSSTETNTSASTGKENMPPSTESGQAPGQHGSPFKEVSTDELYEQWADTYDHDGNILQFVDDLQMHELMDRFVQLCTSHKSDSEDRRLELLDLGCGTGRNTLKLLQVPWPSSKEVSIHGWDSSQAMLDIARTKCSSNTLQAEFHGANPQFAVVDISDSTTIAQHHSAFFSGLVSTLVLEHIPISAYFTVISRLLAPDGYALITNMHSDMGRLSRAGFRTASGERFKATSYVYTPAETVEAAGVAGLELVGEVGEASVDERMIDGGVLDDGVKVDRGHVDERARKWVGIKVWYGMVLQKKG